ncbi:MAG TPA: class I SAM-dependent methyltransferase [Methylophilaceae bacterium]
MQDWISHLYSNEQMLDMGHHQRKEDLNLGLGWLYYGLVRNLRPQRVVVIGSWRGFTPLVCARAMQDNLEHGELIFIDPSLVDEQWADAQKVAEYFAGYGVDNIRHFRMTTQEFAKSKEYRNLGEIGLLFVDGYHSAEQARFDHEAFEPMLGETGIALLHDSIRPLVSNIYGAERQYMHTVYRYIEELREAGQHQVFDFPFASGVSLVQRLIRKD